MFLSVSNKYASSILANEHNNNQHLIVTFLYMIQVKGFFCH